MTNNEITRKNHPFNEAKHPLSPFANLFGSDSFIKTFRPPSWVDSMVHNNKIWEDEEGTHIEYVAAGFEKENINVEFNETKNMLTINAQQDEGEASRKFNASFTTHAGTKKDDIKTSYKNGILRVDIHKNEAVKEATKTHKIEIE